MLPYKNFCLQCKVEWLVYILVMSSLHSALSCLVATCNILQVVLASFLSSSIWKAFLELTCIILGFLHEYSAAYKCVLMYVTFHATRMHASGWLEFLILFSDAVSGFSNSLEMLPLSLATWRDDQNTHKHFPHLRKTIKGVCSVVHFTQSMS